MAFLFFFGSNKVQVPEDNAISRVQMLWLYYYDGFINGIHAIHSYIFGFRVYDEQNVDSGATRSIQKNVLLLRR